MVVETRTDATGAAFDFAGSGAAVDAPEAGGFAVRAGARSLPPSPPPPQAVSRMHVRAIVNVCFVASVHMRR